MTKGSPDANITTPKANITNRGTKSIIPERNITSSEASFIIAMTNGINRDANIESATRQIKNNG